MNDRRQSIRTDDPNFCVPKIIREARERRAREEAASARVLGWILGAFLVVVAAIALPVLL